MVCFLSEGKANIGLIQISLVFPNLLYKYLLTAQAQNSAQGELLSQEKCKDSSDINCELLPCFEFLYFKIIPLMHFLTNEVSHSSRK